MADLLDVERLKSGEVDLTYCDFTATDFSKLDLRGRDFSRSNFARARFHDTDFRGANLVTAAVAQTVFGRCNFADTKIPRSLSRVTFDESILRNVDFRLAVIARSSFNRCDLRGSRFGGATLSRESTFDDAIIDETTDFSGFKMNRAMSRLPIFDGYDFKDGELVRADSSVSMTRSTSAEAQPDARSEELRGELTNQLERVEAALSAYRALPSRDHNNPPELVDDEPLPESTRREITQAVATLRTQAVAEKPDSATLVSQASVLRRAAAAIGAWLARKADIAVDAVVGSGAVAGVIWAYNNPAILQTALLEASATASEWAHYLASKW